MKTIKQINGHLIECLRPSGMGRIIHPEMNKPIVAEMKKCVAICKKSN